MSLAEILPLVNQLPHTDKLQLMQVLLCRIAAEENVTLSYGDAWIPAIPTSSTVEKTPEKIRLQDLVPRQVAAFEPLSREAVYER